MLDAFSYPFMQRALIAGLLVGVICATLSAYVVTKRWAFIGQGISHAAFGGIALGLLLGINITVASVVFCLATAFLIGATSRSGRVSSDTAIGIFLTASMALGALFIAMRSDYSVDVFSYLFGNILATSAQDIYVTIVVAALVLGFVVLFYKELWSFAFDEQMAQAGGLPVRFLHYGLLALISLTIVVAVKAVGLILVSALLILPGAIARPMSKHLLGMILMAVVVSCACVFIGLWLSYVYDDMPSGATIVLSLLAMFVLSLLLSRTGREKAS